MSKIYEKFDDLRKDPALIFKHKIILSIVLSIFVVVLYVFKIITNINESIDVVIALASGVLTVLAMVMSIIMVLREKEIVKKLNEIDKHIMRDFYRNARQGILSAGSIIAISLVIKVSSITLWLYKLFFAFLGTFFFFMMLFCTMVTFIVAFQMLELETKNNT